MLMVNGHSARVFLNGRNTTGILNGTVVWGLPDIPVVVVPANVYYSSNSFVKAIGASGSGTAASGETFIMSASSVSGRGFDTSFVNSAISPTVKYWGLGGSAVGMRISATAKMPATGIDFNNIKTGIKQLYFAQTMGTGSWGSAYTTAHTFETRPYISKSTVVSSVVSGSAGVTSIHTAYASAGSSDTAGFYKVNSSTLTNRLWLTNEGTKTTRFSGAFSGVRTGTADTHTYTLMYYASNGSTGLMGSSYLPYGQTGAFTQVGFYNNTNGFKGNSVVARVSSGPNAFGKYTTAGVGWSATVRVP